VPELLTTQQSLLTLKAVSQIAVFTLQFAASLLSGVSSFTARARSCHLLNLCGKWRWE